MRRLPTLLPLVWLAAGCASTGGRGLEQRLAPDDRRYLRSPTEDYSRAIGPTTRRRLDESYQALLATGDRAPAASLAAELLGRNPDMHPARVLAAQADFVDGNCGAAVTRLVPVVEEEPLYAPAQLVYGRCSEKLGQLVDALEAYLKIADYSALAGSRAMELRPRAVEIMALRIEDALSKGHTGDAQLELERLQSWAPASDRTLEITARVAASAGDSETELSALRSLTKGPAARDEQIERRAELELEIGDPATGMRLLEELAAAHPEDVELEEKLMRSRFIWRLQLLPPEPRQLAAEPELDRGGFAALLYWLFPEVRYGRGSAARIANDVFDHPRRDEIVRVVNMDLMDVDPNLHQFRPYRPVLRVEVLSGMLRLLARRQPLASCLGADGASPPTTSWRICGLAAACRLIDEEADCLPNATVSGREVLEFSRVAQELSGGQ